MKDFFQLGKEVLIIAVIQAILIYTMSCFKLPKGLCEDVNKLCPKIWWGDIRDKRKIHWVSWKKLCKRKGRGRLGFRDLNYFNQALLAKQS